MDSAKAFIASIVTVATVTILVLPRRGTPVPTTITTISKYVTGAVGSMLGTQSVSTRKKGEN